MAQASKRASSRTRAPGLIRAEHMIRDLPRPDDEAISGKSPTVMPHQTRQLEVVVSSPDQLQELLEDAEATLRHSASCQRSAGILVTRHDHGRYTLALSDSVPFGETREDVLP